MKAYDIEVPDWRIDPSSMRRDRPDKNGHGWCFGLPPGITPEQWPLDPATGYPLKHGFTLRLPEDYQVHGPEIVALSFFATEHLDARWDGDPRVPAVIETPGDEPPNDPDLVPFWRQSRMAHPRLFRMRDGLDSDYAVVLLTAAEFEGALCLPPRVESPLLQRFDPPEWLTLGSAAAYERFSRWPTPSLEYDLRLYQPFTWKPRACDPNAGIPPRDPDLHEPVEGGYQDHCYWVEGEDGTRELREHDWAVGHEEIHIGGTMRPSQWIPEFSPFYIEFSQEFGGYNFGEGIAQLDFRDMKFDWSCG